MQDRRDRGFTIIELLVVTMIILLLISLLMPAFRGSVTVSQMALCQSNQHQQGLGMLGYATTYSAFPGAHSISENGKTIAIWVTRCRAFMSGGRGPFYCPAEPAGWAWQTVYGSGTDYATANDVRNWMYEPNELLLEVWAVPFSYGSTIGAHAPPARRTRTSAGSAAISASAAPPATTRSS